MNAKTLSRDCLVEIIISDRHCMILKLHTRHSWCLTRPGIAILGASISLGDEPVKANIPRPLIFTSQNCQTKYSTLTSRDNDFDSLGFEEVRNHTDFYCCYCSNKSDCLINERLFLRKLKPPLNVQTDRFVQRYSLEELTILCYYAHS